LKEEDRIGIQGEFGIGLLSFWVVADRLNIVSSGEDRNTYQMKMRKGEPDYNVSRKHLLMPI
jgi:HSP90 family molecular chaperone